MSARSDRVTPIPVVLVRLKVQLMKNRSRSRGGVIRLVLGAIAAATFGITGFFLGIAVAHATDPRVSRAAVVLGATLLVLGWALLPLLAFGTDETLDPARLQLLPLEKRPLISGLLLASFVGYAPLAVLLTMAGVVVGYASGVGTAVTLAAVIILALLSAATARALATALAATLTSRRGRDVVIVVGAVVGVSAQLLRFVRWDHVDAALVDRLSNVARWLPPGMLGQAIVDARTGHLARALPQLLPALVAVPLLLAAWAHALDRSLTVVTGGSTRKRVAAGPARSSALLPRALPFLRANPRGAVAAKELRCIARDPRRKVQFAQILVIGIGGPVYFALTAGALSPSSVVLASLAGYLGLIGALNQFGFDGGALWLDVVAGNGVRDELIGKNIALVVQVLPVVLLGSVILAAVSGGWIYIPVALIVAAAGLGAGLSVANVISVRYPQRVPDTRSPFGGAAGGQGCVTALMLFAGMFAQGVLLAPVAIATGVSAALAPATLVVVAPACALYGYILWRGGVTMAERWAWWRQPEILLAVDPRKGA